MVHALQEGECSSASLNIIEKYYASKNQINSCEDNPVNQKAQYDSNIRPSDITKQQTNTRKTDDLSMVKVDDDHVRRPDAAKTYEYEFYKF